MEKNLINLIQQGDHTNANSELNTQLMIKVADAFENRKKDIAQGLFKEEEWNIFQTFWQNWKKTMSFLLLKNIKHFHLKWKMLLKWFIQI